MQQLFLIFVSSYLGAMTTYLATLRTKLSPVLVSSALSLVVACAFWIFVYQIGEPTVKLIAVTFFGGSFVGMSAVGVIKKTINVAFAGILFGVVYALTSQFFVGYGGGLGFRASLSVITTLGLVSLIEKVTSFLRK